MMNRVVFLTISILLLSLAVLAQKAPFTDYCEMLEKEIQGKQHGFMAGNSTFYIGGKSNVWEQVENETIGLTHPFFNDLRCRGTGKVSHVKADGWDTGYGHDLWGWNFHRDVKVAYGTVTVNEIKFRNPSPARMYCDPDEADFSA